MNAKICDMVTQRILAELDAGAVPWRQGWISAGGAKSHTTGNVYSILNQMLVGRPGEYLTYPQATKEGGKVRRGEKSRPIVFWKMIVKDEKEESLDGKTTVDVPRRGIPFLHYFNVFHVDQCDGIEEKFPREYPCKAAPIESAEAIWRGYCERERIKIETTQLQDRAFYRVRIDGHEEKIVVPAMKQFESTEDYYGALFHEVVHSTGRETRLNRPKAEQSGDQNYAREELVAEIGAAYLMNYCGIATDASLKNNAAYIDHWRKAISSDKEIVVVAAGRAQKAVNFILGIGDKA